MVAWFNRIALQRSNLLKKQREWGELKRNLIGELKGEGKFKREFGLSGELGNLTGEHKVEVLLANNFCWPRGLLFPLAQASPLKWEVPCMHGKIMASWIMH